MTTAFCSYFLRQGINGLQVRHLQPASCLYFKIEITTGTGKMLGFVSYGHFEITVMAESEKG